MQTSNVQIFHNFEYQHIFKMEIHTTKLELLKTILDNDNSEFIQHVSDFVKEEKMTFGMN